MIAEPRYPLAAIRGSLTRDHYVRVVNGKLVVQRKPKRTKPPTEKQLAVREAFGRRQREKQEGRGKGRSGIVVVS